MIKKKDSPKMTNESAVGRFNMRENTVGKGRKIDGRYYQAYLGR